MTENITFPQTTYVDRDNKFRSKSGKDFCFEHNSALPVTNLITTVSLCPIMLESNVFNISLEAVNVLATGLESKIITLWHCILKGYVYKNGRYFTDKAT